MQSNNQLERFVELVRRHIIHLAPLPTADALAKEFSISKRTAYRDLNYLKDLLKELNNKRLQQP